MRCRTCDYSLWRIGERRCPECGSPFVPSQFEFRRNAVAFRCPHCAQAYYGTGRRGHLEPAEFGCASCGERVRMDEMTLEPAPGVGDDEAEVRYSPWLDPRARTRRLFGVSRWARTAMMALTSPVRLMRCTPVESSVARAALFSLVTQVVFSLFTAVPIAILMLFAAVMGSGSARAGLTAMLVGTLWYGLSLALTIGLTLAWALLSHMILRTTGGAPCPLGRTIQAVCYSTPGFLLVAIPCVGTYAAPLSLIWWACLASVMLQAGHGVRPWRAWVAGMIPPVVLGVLAVAAAVAFVLAVGNVQTSWQGSSANRFGAQLLGDALRAEADANGMPAHVARLMADDPSLASAAVDWQGSTDPARVRIGAMTLADFADDRAGLGPRELAARLESLRRAAEEAAAALPDGVIAYRVADFVFTHSGMAWPPPEGDLWLVVESPMGRQGPQAMGVAVVEADGDVVEFGPGGLAGGLAAQNALRALHGLPPLPDPATVTHGAPAVAGGAPQP